MNILIFAEAPEHTQLTEPIENHHRMLFRQVSLTATSDYDQLISLLKEDRFDLVFRFGLVYLEGYRLRDPDRSVALFRYPLHLSAWDRQRL